jgi:hypothetical protein
MLAESGRLQFRIDVAYQASDLGAGIGRRCQQLSRPSAARGNGLTRILDQNVVSLRQTIRGLSASRFGVADPVTHATPIALAPDAFTSLTPVSSSSATMSCSEINSIDFFVVTRQFFFVTQLRHTTITTRVENNSEINSIDLFVVTRHFFSWPYCSTRR